MSARRLDRLTLRTPEGAEFSYRLAGPGLRFAAAMIDLSVVAAAASLVGWVLRLLVFASVDVYGLITAVALFVLTQGYFLVSEWVGRGRTLGKRIMGLRVVDAGAMPLQPGQVVVRNVLRVVDQMPVLYLVGVMAILASRRAQRLGDLAAGTVVIWEKPEPMPDFTRIGGEKFNTLKAHAAAVARLRQAVPPAEAALAARVLARRDALEDGARLRLFGELADRFRTAGKLPPDAIEGLSDEQVVRNAVEVLYGTVVSAPPMG